MAEKLSRRRLALAAVPLITQTPASAQAPDNEDDLTIQRENLKRWREQTAKVSLPMSAEPAFTFRA
ncbi:MAG TPA: hypothetical protein VM120_27015 [Bryobacteraceae bacterium]|nr:hypothetical protein [Bryobacteraceae bacterium]